MQVSLFVHHDVGNSVPSVARVKSTTCFCHLIDLIVCDPRSSRKFELRQAEFSGFCYTCYVSGAKEETETNETRKCYNTRYGNERQETERVVKGRQ